MALAMISVVVNLAGFDFISVPICSRSIIITLSLLLLTLQRSTMILDGILQGLKVLRQ